MHLHLTDDQGWRFEVPRYPRLTEVGAYRRESPAGHEAAGVGDGTPHGGFYTQAELRDAGAVRARRGVTIVPEIDLPGHTQAAVAAYPELGNDPEARHEVWTRFGISPHILNPDDATLEFMRQVLDELMGVFPSPYIHLGGDEVPTQEWSANPNAQKRMAELGIDDPRDLLSWWIGQLGGHIAAHGRTAVVWDELVGTGPDDGVVIMAWRGPERVAEAVRAGHRVIASPHTHMYLNYPQSDATGGAVVDRRRRGHRRGRDDAVGRRTGTTPARARRARRAGQPVDGVRGRRRPGPSTTSCPGWPPSPRWPGAPPATEADLRRRLATHLRRLDAAGITYRPLDP